MGGARRRSRTVTAGVVAVVVFGTGAVALLPAWAAVAITSSGPLTKVETSDVLNCAVNHSADRSGEFYSDTACGTFVSVAGTLFAPTAIPAGSFSSTAYTPVSQSAVTGAGTAADPFKHVTVADAGTTGIRVTQTDTYVVGQESYRTDVTLTNGGTATATGILWRAGDCFLQDSDRGFGSQDARTGAVACVAPDPANPSTPGARIEQWLPLTAGSRSYEAGYSEVWSKINSQQEFDGTCRCTESIDNGAGLSWSYSVPAGGSRTFGHITTFSPLGRLPLSATKTADAARVPPGARTGYRITVNNPNNAAVTVTRLVDTLPAGFAYVAGTTTGATTTDPTAAGQALTWAGSFSVPAGGNIQLAFGVTASSTPGTYMNEVSGEATDHTLSPSGPTAAVEVASGATPPPTSPPSTSPPTTPPPTAPPATTGPRPPDDPPIPTGVTRVDGGGTSDPAAIARQTCDLLTDRSPSRKATAVLLARLETFADALAGAALAGRNSCILFNVGGPDATLDPANRSQMQRVLVPGGPVTILGGPNAISSGIESGLRADGFAVTRLSGPTRYETAEAVAREVLRRRSDAPPQVLLAWGENWPDAVTAGAYAAARLVPIVLTPTATLHPAAQRIISEVSGEEVIAIGGRQVISDEVVAASGARRVAGSNRMHTAAEIALQLWPAVPLTGRDYVVVNLEASEQVWQLALQAAPLAARIGGPQLGVRATQYPPETQSYLQSRGFSELPRVVLLGNLSIISGEVASAIDDDIQPR